MAGPTSKTICIGRGVKERGGRRVAGPPAHPGLANQSGRLTPVAQRVDRPGTGSTPENMAALTSCAGAAAPRGRARVQAAGRGGTRAGRALLFCPPGIHVQPRLPCTCTPALART
jgi:hypothetical protein